MEDSSNDRYTGHVSFRGGIMCWLPPRAVGYTMYQTEVPISAKDGMGAGMYGSTEGYCSYPRFLIFCFAGM